MSHPLVPFQPRRFGGGPPRALGPIGACVWVPASLPWAAACSVIGGGPFWPGAWCVRSSSERTDGFRRETTEFGDNMAVPRS